jgi:hypothetical protein
MHWQDERGEGDVSKKIFLQDLQKDGTIYFVMSVLGFDKSNARMYDGEIVPAETFI